MNINIFMKLRLLCKAENLYLHKLSFTSTLSYLIFFYQNISLKNYRNFKHS